MAEDFGARSDSPQVACLKGVRESDLFILMLGARYGAVQPASGLSATHEEFLEAHQRKPLLVFVQEGVEREPKQAEFVAEVQAWQGGYLRDGFTTTDELRAAVTRALHDYQLANATGPVNAAQLVETAVSLLPRGRGNQRADRPTLHLGIAGGPRQRLLRPAELEARTLSEFIQREAQFGSQRVFDKARGTDESIENHAIVLRQERGAVIRLTESGDVHLALPLDGGDDRDRRHGGLDLAIIEETVGRWLIAGIGFANLMIDHIDATQRLTQVAIAVQIDAPDYMGWRTQAQQDASPHSGTMRMGSNDDLTPVHLQVPRPKVRLAAKELAEDLTAKLRRQRVEPRRR
jgi:hypothetical protein